MHNNNKITTLPVYMYIVLYNIILVLIVNG